MLLKQIGCTQNHLRRISKKILWVKLSSDQLTQQNPHQEWSGSEVSVLHSTWTKGFNEKKEREIPSTHLRFWDFSVMNTMEVAWGWIQRFSLQNTDILQDDEKIKRRVPVSCQWRRDDEILWKPWKKQQVILWLCFHCGVRNGFDYWDGLQFLHINNIFDLKCNCWQVESLINVQLFSLSFLSLSGFFDVQ